MKIRPLLSIFLAFLLSLGPIFPSLDPLQLVGTLTSHAATITWTGAGANELWSNSANWSGGRVPSADDVVMVAAVAPGASSSPVIDQPVSVGGLELAADFSGTLDNRAGQALTIGQSGLVQRGGTFTGGSGSLQILGSFSLFGGRFIAPSGTLSVHGTWNSTSGKFEHNNGSVVLDGIEQVVFGSVVFNDFTKTAGVGQTLQFQSGKTITTLGTLRLAGSAATPGGDSTENILKIRASASGAPVMFEPQGTVEAAYLDLQDVINISPATPVCDEGCHNSGNVSGWQITAAPAPTAVPAEVADQARALLERVREVRDSLPTLAASSLPPARRQPPTASPRPLVPRRLSAPASPAPSEDLLLEGLPSTDFAADAPVFFTITFDDETPLESAALTPATGEAPTLPPAAALPEAPPTVERLNWLRVPVAHAEADKALSSSEGDPVFQPASMGDLTVTDVALTNPAGEPANITPAVYNDGGQLVVYVPKPATDFHPGRYRLVVHLEKNKIPRQITQDFTWGVLALNVSQSSYRLGESVTVGMGVLDDGGHTICDADLQVDITAPDGAKRTLTSAAGDIKFSPDCDYTSVTDNPDYRVTFTANQPGVHILTLAARTKNGERTIVDGFVVSSGEPFVATRTAATRIWPSAAYTMSVTLTANRDFAGQLLEFVPEDFEITDVVLTTPTAGLTTTAFTRAPSDDGRDVLISPPLALAKGEKATLTYTFDAPDISPRFYLLGDLILIDRLDIPAGTGGPSVSELTAPIVAESVFPSPSVTPAVSPEPSVSPESLTGQNPSPSPLPLSGESDDEKFSPPTPTPSADPSLAPSSEDDSGVLKSDSSPTVLRSSPSEAGKIAKLKIENYIWTEPRSWQIASDAIKTWDGGGGDNNWSTGANWSGDTVPATTDAVVFDATSTKNATVDSLGTWSGGAFSMNAGYTGTITVNASMTVGAVTIDAGTLSISSAQTITSSESNWTYTAGTISGSGTVLFSGDGNGGCSLTITGSHTLPNVTFRTTSTNAGACTWTIASLNTLTVSSTLTFDSTGNDGVNIDTGTLAAQGDITVADSAAYGGTGALNITGTGAQTLTGSGTTDAGNLPDVNINKSAGTLTISGTTRTQNDWTYTAGTLAGTGTVVFGGINGSATITGSHTLSGVTFNSTSNNQGAQTWTIASGTTLTVSSTLTFDGLNPGSDVTINTGTLAAQGNITIADDKLYGGTGKILINGTGAQTLTGSALYNAGNIVDVEINKASGTLTISGTTRTQNDWTYTAGTIAGTGTIAFGGQFSSATITGSHTLPNVTFTNNSTSQGAQTWTIASGTTLTVSGTLTFDGNNINADVTINTGSLVVQGDINVEAGGAYGGTAVFSLTGTANQNFDLTGATAQLDLDVTINKTGGAVTLLSDLTMNATGQDLTITAGTFDQGASYTVTTNTATTVSSGGAWLNNGTGDLVLGGNVTNSGLIMFNGGGGACGTDEIAITSSVGGTQRTWTTNAGAETLLTDVNATDQAGTLTVYSSTNTSNNAWTFSATCIQGVIWDDGGVGSNWSTGGNWSGDVAPGTNDVAIFSNTSSTASTIDANASTRGMWVLNGYSNTITQNTSITLTVDASDYVHREGTFTGGNSTIDINGTYTLSGGTFTSTSGTLSVSSDFTRSGGTFTHNSGTVTLDGISGTIDIVSGGSIFYNLTLNDGGGPATFEVEDALDVNNNLTITGGTLDTKLGENNSINVAGTWANSDTFTARSSTVTLDGTNQTINGSTSFYNLTKQETSNDTSDAILTLEASSTQTVTNTFNLDGLDANDELQLRSSVAGTRHTWTVSSAGAATRLDVKDSQTSTSDITCTDCTNAGGNDNAEASPRWVFVTTGPTTEQVMRHGNWWSSQTEQSFFW